jgi:alpha-tubulin suppressor-like RCC1 family protein
MRTNVPYAQGTSIALWSSRSGNVGAPVVEANDPWLADGEVGDVVVVPGDASKDSTLTVRVAMGLRGKRAAECTDEGDAKDCIIARRKLSFVPHARLKVPIVMYLACEGVKCSEDTTCSYLGQCVPAQVDPAACQSPDGCTLPGEPPFVPSVTPDAGRDTSVDVLLDAEAPKDTGSDVPGVPTEFDAAVDAPILGPSVAELAAGERHTCARFDDGTVKCWGRNDSGQLGLGDTQNRGDGPGEMGANLPTIDLGPGRTALQLTAGTSHSCARLDDGSVKCWGLNAFGQLGLGDTVARGDGPGEMGANLPSINLGPGRTALQLAAGFAHTCAQLDDGSVKCWGLNNVGQLGLGDTGPRGDGPGEMGTNLPTIDLGPGRTALQVAAGTAHTCARLDNGAAKCWGHNDRANLGLGDLVDRGDGPGEMGANLPAIDLGAGRTALQVSAGEDHTCARLDNGSAKCWGDNTFGTLGLGDTQGRGTGPGEMGANLPTVDLGPLRSALQVLAASARTCARLDNGSVKCWGRNNDGQLGLGDTQSRGNEAGEMGTNLPTIDLGAGRTVLQLSAGASHTCARLDDGSVKCWGYNVDGELGLGDTLNRGDGPGQMGAALPVVQLK